MEQINKVLWGLFTSPAFFLTMFFVGGVCTGYVAFAFLYASPVFFLIGWLGLVIFSAAGTATGYFYMRPIHEKREATNQDIVGMFLSIIALGISVFLIMIGASYFSSTFSRNVAGIVTIAFFMNALAGMSLRFRERSTIVNIRQNVWTKRLLLLIRLFASVALLTFALIVTASCIEATYVDRQPEQLFFCLWTLAASIGVGLILGSRDPDNFGWLVLTFLCTIVGMVLMIFNGPISLLQVVALPVLGILFGLVFPIPGKRIFENSERKNIMKPPAFRTVVQLTISVALIIFVLVHLFYGNLANAASSAFVGLVLWTGFSIFTIVSPPKPDDAAIQAALGIENGPKTFSQVKRGHSSKSPKYPADRERELEEPDI